MDRLRIVFVPWLMALLSALAACAPVVVPAGPAVTVPALDGSRIVAADGASLPLRHWPAQANGGDGQPKAVILALHGFGDYSSAFEEPAATWAAQGIETYAYDQRGFGDAPHRGRWAGVDALADDALTALRLLAARHPGTPIYLAGESMGGAVALVALGRLADHPALAPMPVGAILIGPAVRSRDTIGAAGRAGLWVAAHLLPWHPVGPTSIDFQPSDNREMLKKYAKDPKVLHYPRTDMVWGLVDLMDAAKQAAPKLATPYLLLYGLNDRVVPEGPMRGVIAALPRRADSRLAFYAKGYHMLLRDLDAEALHRDVAAWIADKNAPLASGADRRRADLQALWGSHFDSRSGGG
ncbi:MAG: lysophospholipase [Alphaproteobacteria bacterium]|nr:lysophospholipase [Alphaproteobacteria bacterium]